MPVSTHRTAVQVRFGDTDALGHVNNAAYASYAEVARLDFLGRLGKSVQSLILAKLHIDFRRQVSYTDRVSVESWVEALGRSSITLLQTIYAEDERAADVRSVVVHFDYAANRSQELEPSMREALAPYVRTDATPA
jgi:acyl-CoA thioester hydrolase